MSKPTEFIVSWEALGDEPAGSLVFYCRARARGFQRIRKAAGFICTFEAKGY